MEAALLERDRVGVQDFVLLNDHLSLSEFIDNLEKRFKNDLIYVSWSVHHGYLRVKYGYLLREKEKKLYVAC